MVVKSVGSEARLGSNSVSLSTTHYLCDLGKVTEVLSIPTSSCAKRGGLEYFTFEFVILED